MDFPQNTNLELNLLQALADELKKRKLTLAAAESLTGGLVSRLLTSVPGSSEYFQVGITAYSNQAKVEFLGVPFEVILEHGAVSEQCAQAMAAGLQRKAGVHWALATTGLAGPKGARPLKPVGLVWLAVSGPGFWRTSKKLFSGDRESISRQAAWAALELLKEGLKI